MTRVTYDAFRKHVDERLPWLKERSAEIDRSGRLPDDVVAWLIEQGLFKLFLPQTLGGHALSLEEAVALVMLIAQGDGSVAWQVQIGSGGNYFLPSLSSSVAKMIFSPPAAVIAGSGYVGGYAYPEAGGYRVSGYWRYASGAQYATTFTANALVLKAPAESEAYLIKLREAFSNIRRDGIIQRGDEDGEAANALRTERFTSFHTLLRSLQKALQHQAAIRAFAFTREEVETFSDWEGMGMRGTSSAAMLVRDVFVPEERTFVVGETGHTHDRVPVQHIPFVSFAEASIGAVVIGLAQALAEEITYLLPETGLRTHNTPVAALLQEAIDTFRYMKDLYIEAVRQLDDKDQEDSVQDIVPMFSWTVRHAVRTIRLKAWEVFPYLGMQVLDSRSRINRVMRDMETAAHHVMLL